MSRYDADNVYCYENSVVLRNKLGITDQLLLEKFESDMVCTGHIVYTYPITSRLLWDQKDSRWHFPTSLGTAF
jgi:hypothetical protein